MASKQSNLDNGLADARQVGSRPHAAQQQEENTAAARMHAAQEPEENTTASSSIGEDALARDLSSGVEGSVRSEPRQRRERTALTPREYSRGLGDTQEGYSDDDEPIPEWVFTMLWWPVSFCGFILRVIGRFSKLAFLLSVSAATYFWIYSAMVPPSLSEHHPINFQYPALHEERESGVPANATVDFAFRRQLMLRSGDRGMDWSSGMAPGSSLDVGVTLELPESQANYNVGTFTINVTVYDKQGQAVGQGSRSMVLRHKTALLQTISTLVFSVPLVMALTSEHQVVRGTAVQLVSLPTGGLHSATLSLSDSRLQVYSAYVDITFVLTGFRYYMFHWFLTSMAVGTIIISNLYVAAIGWLSHRIFGASFDVDEELGGARKKEKTSTRRGSRQRRAARNARDSESESLRVLGRRTSRSSTSDQESLARGRHERRRSKGGSQAFSSHSNMSSGEEEDSGTDTHLNHRSANWDLDDSDADWRTRKTSDTNTSFSGYGTMPQEGEGVSAWSREVWSTTASNPPVTSDSADDTREFPAGGRGRGSDTPERAPDTSTPSPAAAAHVRRRHATLPFATLPSAAASQPS